jgi:multidrug efflux system membrane fusion protein
MKSRIFATIPLLALLVLPAGCARRSSAPAGAPPVPVTAAKVEARPIPVEIRAIGHVDPYSVVSVKSQVGGVLTDVWFREGEEVRKGQRLFTIDPRPYEAALAQARADLQRDRAQAANARDQAARYAELVKKDFVTRQQYDDARASADALEATVRADEAALENARLQLSYCTIASPIDGKTGSVLVQRGNVVKANDVPIVVINQIRPIYVTFSVPEADLSEIQLHAAKGKLVVLAQPPGRAESEKGALTFIDNTVNPETGTINLKGTFPNAADRLWPGQFVNATLQLSVEHNAIVVPTPAIQTGQSGQFVYVIKPDLTVEPRDVVVDRTAGPLSVVRKGLAAGEQVVTDGQLRLSAGSKVEIKAAPEARS